MASYRIFAAALLLTILVSTEMKITCISTIVEGGKDECEACVIMYRTNPPTKGCLAPKSLHDATYDKCFNDNGEIYYACKTNKCNEQTPACGPAPAPPPAPAAAAKKPSGSASCQPMVVVLGLVGVVRLLH